MEWIDVSCRGGSARDHASGVPTVAQLLLEMERLRITGALVTSVWSEVVSADVANPQLFEDLSPHENLWPIAELLPEGGEQFLDRQADAIAWMVSQGAVAGVVKCRKNKHPLTTWCIGALLEAMSAARLPLVVYHDDVDPNDLFGVLQDFPDLPVVLSEIPRVGYNRIAYPLMARCPNLYAVCDTPSFVHLGVEYMVDRFGPHRILWGTRYPGSEGGAAIAGITYADIPDQDKAAIAGGNIRRLMSEVGHG
jgi:hypothetical protein